VTQGDVQEALIDLYVGKGAIDTSKKLLPALEAQKKYCPFFPLTLHVLIKTLQKQKRGKDDMQQLFAHFQREDRVLFLRAANSVIFCSSLNRSRISLEEKVKDLTHLLTVETQYDRRATFFDRFVPFILNENSFDELVCHITKQENQSVTPYLLPKLINDLGFFELDNHTLSLLIFAAFPEKKEEVLRMPFLYREKLEALEFLFSMLIVEIDGDRRTCLNHLEYFAASLEREGVEDIIPVITQWVQKLPLLFFWLGMQQEDTKPLLLKLLPYFTEEQIQSLSAVLTLNDIQKIFPDPFLSLREKQREILLLNCPKSCHTYLTTKLLEWLEDTYATCKKNKDAHQASFLLITYIPLIEKTSKQNIPRLNNIKRSLVGLIENLKLSCRDEQEEEAVTSVLFHKLSTDDFGYLGIKDWSTLGQLGIYSDEDFAVLGLSDDDHKNTFLSTLQKYINQNNEMLTCWQKFNAEGIDTLSEFAKRYPGKCFEIGNVCGKRVRYE
jgi:hypothetical protein